jgi:HAD superfamily hydrolase (TIGR01509 family)
MDKKYILFDNDGVLVETEHLYYEASKRALKEFFDLDIRFDDYMKIMTDGKGVWVAVPWASDEDIVVARNKRDVYYQEYLKSEDTVIDGVEDVLNELSKKYNMAIVTTSRRVDFDIIHHSDKITKYMDFILCVEDYPNSKPHPDPYLKGVELFGANKGECIVVEDSQRGLISANSANIDCVIVHNEFTKTQDFSLAQYKIDNFSQLLSIL